MPCASLPANKREKRLLIVPVLEIANANWEHAVEFRVRTMETEAVSWRTTRGNSRGQSKHDRTTRDEFERFHARWLLSRWTYVRHVTRNTCEQRCGFTRGPSAPVRLVFAVPTTTRCLAFSAGCTRAGIEFPGNRWKKQRDNVVATIRRWTSPLFERRPSRVPIKIGSTIINALVASCL